MGSLLGRFGKEDAIVADDADGITVQPGESGHNRVAKLSLELVKDTAKLEK